MTNQRIHALPLHLANQIAAGEVIERPASVVKELVENSLDADATEIHIHIEGAGNKLIQVRDNGAGIHPEDLALALSRHATSKLHTTAQLSEIASLGFRGEALPSIASVSQLTIDSKQADQNHGWQYQLDNELSPSNHPNGTTIHVRDLFFNIPARRHFLRSDKTELNHITTTIHRLALSQFNTAFFCQLTDNNQLRLPAANTPEQQQQRIAKICGQQFIKNSLHIEQHYDKLSLTGWIADQQGHRPQTDIQYFFINGRVTRDRVINHAIRQAYADLIPEGRYPAFVLYLSMPFDQVDINVHPTKHEVRFRDARLIHGLITQAIREALLNTPQSEQHNDLFEPQESIESITTAITTPETTVAELATPYQTKLSKPSTSHQPQSSGSNKLINNRYLIIERQGHHALIDLQQAQYRQTRQDFIDAVNNHQLSSRPILVPIKVTLTETQLALFQQHNTLLNEFGFQLSLSEQHLTIDNIPSLFAQSQLTTLISELAQQLSASTNRDQLITILSKLLPQPSIQSTEQATTILNRLNLPDDNNDWYRRLDDITLAELFIQ